MAWWSGMAWHYGFFPSSHPATLFNHATHTTQQPNRFFCLGLLGVWDYGLWGVQWRIIIIWIFFSLSCHVLRESLGQSGGRTRAVCQSVHRQQVGQAKLALWTGHGRARGTARRWVGWVGEWVGGDVMGASSASSSSSSVGGMGFLGSLSSSRFLSLTSVTDSLLVSRHGPWFGVYVGLDGDDGGRWGGGWRGVREGRVETAPAVFVPQNIRP